jgi:hypothetical protein
MNSNPSDGEAISRIRVAIDEALRSRLRLQEARIDALVHQCRGVESHEVQQALADAAAESQRTIQALNAQLLTAEG